MGVSTGLRRLLGHTWDTVSPPASGGFVTATVTDCLWLSPGQIEMTSCFGWPEGSRVELFAGLASSSKSSKTRMSGQTLNLVLTAALSHSDIPSLGSSHSGSRLSTFARE